MSIGKTARNGIQQHLVLSHSMQEIVCKNPSFHSLHLYATNKAACEEGFVTGTVQNLRGAECRHI